MTSSYFTESFQSSESFQPSQTYNDFQFVSPQNLVKQEEVTSFNDVILPSQDLSQFDHLLEDFDLDPLVSPSEDFSKYLDFSACSDFPKPKSLFKVTKPKPKPPSLKLQQNVNHVVNTKTSKSPVAAFFSDVKKGFDDKGLAQLVLGKIFHNYGDITSSKQQPHHLATGSFKGGHNWQDKFESPLRDTFDKQEDKFETPRKQRRASPRQRRESRQQAPRERESPRQQRESSSQQRRESPRQQAPQEQRESPGHRESPGQRESPKQQKREVPRPPKLQLPQQTLHTPQQPTTLQFPLEQSPPREQTLVVPRKQKFQVPKLLQPVKGKKKFFKDLVSPHMPYSPSQWGFISNEFQKLWDELEECGK
ncbi:hypothetical protein CJU90_1764 [Yarrowia sp. C11]|nr:hypothetical protein CKK34_0491 [Yarrowia sp. E02]KAG5371704.1 hypothetical protein CJU90_1764 [Yarrowia sp. C11]